MKIIQRQIMTGIVFSVLFFLLFMIVFFIAFPIPDWTLLWERELLDVPFAVLALSLSGVTGIGFGLVSGTYWRKQLELISSALQQLEQGRNLYTEEISQSPDLSDIWKRMTKIQQQMTKQTKLSQKLANEKAEEQERQLQQVVSQERNRLARELHDSVSQQLFAASMMMSAINESEPVSDAQGKQLKMVENMIHQSQLEMRALLLHLRPVALKGKSLQEGIQEILVELSQKVPLDIEWKIEPIPLDKGVEDHLFRILQESVSNTLRHAQAASLKVLLIERDEVIIMRIVDDGIGFDVEEAKAGSYGLQNMQERAIEIGGSLKIVSLKNKGTRLEVKVPILSREGDEND
ncbi:sensor histidine kinase [Bacillus tianshenii]|nr:sensor histidine kinase [Bacillus tianshenii]